MSLSILNQAAPPVYTQSQRVWLAIGLVVFVTSLFVASQFAFAGTAVGGSTGLDDVWTTLTDFVQGTLGRIITLLIIVVGVAAGILRQSLGAFAVGLGAGIGLYYAPDIVDQLFGATIMLPGMAG